MAGLVALGLALWTATRSREATRSADDAPGLAQTAATAQTTAPSTTEEATALDLASVWKKAAVRARAWRKDAVLARVSAGPFSASGEPDPNATALEFEFGLPAQGAGPYPTLGSERLLVVVDPSGTRHEERAQAVPVRAVTEPGCPSEEAIRVAVKAGLSATTVDLHYEYSPARDKSWWRVESALDPKQRRLIDGFSCAVIVN